MKKIIKGLLVFTAAFIISFTMAVFVSAAGNATVVYLKDDGTGDGSSANAPVGSLDAAFNALDLSKDCIIVVCDEFNVPFKNFAFDGSYDGSVTFTSVYGGVDYRTSGAKYIFAPYCFACPVEIRFENIDCVSGNKDGSNGGVVFVAQHHPFTVGEGVTISGGKNLTGGKIAQSFTIIGGYYKSVGTPLSSDTKEINITVLSGSMIYIVGANRNIAGNYGNVNITVGGTASVATLNATSTGVNGSTLGDINITLKDNASIGNFYGSTQTMSAGALTFNWLSGTIEKFFWDCPYMSPVGVVTFDNTILNATEKTEKRANFADIASQFDEVKTTSDVVAEKGTVVFLKDGGTGAGNSADDAVGNFLDAYEALDLTKDCTVVICGTFTTPKQNYIYDGEYEGSVTFTSVYGGVDYRTNGAKYVFMPYCYGSVCETKFENINMVSANSGSNGGVVFVARHYPFTLGEGVSISGGSTLTGATIARSFTIVGGYYTKVGEAKRNDNREININVLSGSKVYIVTANRAIAGTYGNANVYIGGNAEVSTFNATGANVDGATLGDITLTLADNAKILTFYGSTQTMTAASFTLNWNAGTIGKFYWDCPAMNPVGTVTFTNGTTLNASESVKNNTNFSEIAANFTKVNETVALEKPALSGAHQAAVFLNKLNLLAGKGTNADGSINFDEGGSLTRAESIVQVIRFLGKENEVKAGNYSHPFTDVPAWADKYIGYAYTNKITSGRSATAFDPNGKVDEAQFLTLLLRAIGYSDAAGEFVWNNPYSLANKIGMKDSESALASFTRGDAFNICFATLYSTAKNGEYVANNLIDAGVFTIDSLDKAASAALLAKDTNKETSTVVLEKVKIENGYYVLPIETYRDKTLCGMLSQITGVLTGYEMVYLNGVPRFNLPDDWFEFLNGPYAGENAHNKHEDKHTYNEELGLWQVWIDDDYSIDYFDLFMIDDMYEKYGMFASKTISDSWDEYCIYDMGGGHHTFGAYRLATKGYFTDFLGNREYGNMYSYCGEPIIENETLGMIAAGMPYTAADLADTFGSVTSDRDPVIWAEYFSTVCSLAYVENDIGVIIEKSAATLPEGSWERYVVEECLKIYAANPDDWRSGLLECEDRFYLPKYDKEDSMSEASIFSSIIIMGLLYGDGDYMETCKIIALQGNGGESACAVGLGVVGIMHGWENLGISAADKAKMNEMLWQDGKGVVYNRSNTDLAQGYWMHAANLEEYFKMSDLLDAFQRNFERVLVLNGGRIENGIYYIPVSEVPKHDVKLVEDFESGSLDGYITTGTVSVNNNFLSGKYGAKLSGNSDGESRLSKNITDLTVGCQYRVTAYIRTSSKTAAYMYVGDDTNKEYVTVYDSDPFVKRELVFIATKENMEFGIYIPAGLSTYKYAVIDDIIIEKVEEKTAATAKIENVTADSKYTGTVNITVNGKLGKEAFLKITFANPSGAIRDVAIALNGDTSYGVVPIYKTATEVMHGNSDSAYIPVVLDRDVNTITLDTSDIGLYIYNAEVVYKAVERW